MNFDNLLVIYKRFTNHKNWKSIPKNYLLMKAFGRISQLLVVLYTEIIAKMFYF